MPGRGKSPRISSLHPAAVSIGVLLNPAFPPAASQLQELEQAAHKIHQRIVITKASTDEELDAAFGVLVQEQIGAARNCIFAELVDGREPMLRCQSARQNGFSE